MTEYTVKKGKITGTVPKDKAIVLYNEGYEESTVMPLVWADADEYYDMQSDSVQVTLHVADAKEGVYVLGDGEEVKYTDGDVIAVGDNLAQGERIKLTLKAANKEGFTSAMSYFFTKEKKEEVTTIKDGITVYFEKPTDWGDILSAYIYSEKDGGLKILKDWPGTEMTKEKDGRYSFTFAKEWEEGLIIFNDGSKQYPGSNEPGLPIEAKKNYSK